MKFSSPGRDPTCETAHDCWIMIRGMGKVSG
jgi:hypothetical protein